MTTLILLHRTQSGGIYIASSRQEDIFWQNYYDTNGRCIKILFKNVAVKGLLMCLSPSHTRMHPKEREQHFDPHHPRKMFMFSASSSLISAANPSRNLPKPSI